MLKLFPGLFQVGLALIRALLYIARPATCKLGLISETGLYRDVEQYPDANGIAGILILKLGSPIYFANCNYVRERFLICSIFSHTHQTSASSNSLSLMDCAGFLDGSEMSVLLPFLKEMKLNSYYLN